MKKKRKTGAGRKEDNTWLIKYVALLAVVIIVAVIIAIDIRRDDTVSAEDTTDVAATDTADHSGLLRAQLIMFNFNDFETQEEAIAQASSVLERAHAGHDFDWLIERYANPFTTPEGYTFTRGGSMLDEVEDATYALEIGEISDLVMTEFGVYIVKRIAPFVG